MDELFEQWEKAKQDEEMAIKNRRAIEDYIKTQLGLGDDFVGTKAVATAVFSAKISARIDKKVDSDRLQEIAVENGKTDELSVLFRWKPEINAKAWDAAPDEIKALFSKAITSKPGRASFKLERV